MVRGGVTEELDQKEKMASSFWNFSVVKSRDIVYWFMC